MKKQFSNINDPVYEKIPERDRSAIKNMVENSESADDLIAKFEAYKKPLEDKKKKLEDKAKKSIEKIVKANADSVKERREVQKKSLEFLHKIGFDLIPQ